MRKTNFIALAFFLLFFSVPLFAQVDRAHQEKFNFAKTKLNEKNWDAARAAFRELMLTGNQHPFSEYAHYYSGVAAYHKGEHKEAAQLMRQVIDRYPDWHERDEAQYLLGMAEFENKNPGMALESLSRVENRSLRDKANQAKRYYLAGVSNLDELKKLYNQHPRDEVVAENLANRLFYAQQDPQHKALFDRVVREHRLESKFRNRPQAKESYNVAALLPFHYKELNTSAQSRNNQFVLDLYQGMLLAKEDLKDQGVNINLFAYDTEREPERLRRVLAQPEIKGMDLLVGPVYATGAPLVADFAARSRIVTVNPLSNNQSFAENNPYIILAEPSVETQARQAALFASKEFQQRKAIIIYEATPRDSLMAAEYRRVLRENGVETSLFRQIPKGGAPAIRALISATSLDQAGHLFISSADPSIGSAFISALAQKQAFLPIVTRGELLQNTSAITFEQWQRHQVHFIYPGYVNTDRPEVNEFSNRFAKVTNMVPSVYAYQGYDLMMHFGRALHTYGPNFQNDLKQAGYQQGATLGGYNYNNASDNQYVPIVRVLENQLRIVNKVQ
jgi:ABC-type branched-subunit amino acid transport system substrate-binding protein